MDLRVRDVWSSDIPLTGAYSRYGWSHPGPWMYWLVAPFSLAFGQAAWATLVGSALLQGGPPCGWLGSRGAVAGYPSSPCGWRSVRA